MSNLVKGTIEKVGLKKGENKKGKVWKLYSIKIANVWYSCGFNKDPEVNDGDYIKFSWELDDRDNKVIDMESLAKCDPPTSGSSGSGGGDSDKELMWAMRDVRARIGYARSAAIDIVRLALDKDILPWPKSAKAADKFDLLIAMVDKETMHFYGMTEDQVTSIFGDDEDDDLPTDVGAGDDGEDSGDDLDG